MKKTLSLLLSLALFIAMLTGCAPSVQDAGSSGTSGISGTSGTEDTSDSTAGTDSKTDPTQESTENIPPVRVAEELDFAAIDYVAPCFLDLNYYSAGQFDTSETTDKGTYYRVRVYDAPFDCLSLLDAYVEVLCQKFALELVGEPFYYDNERNGDGERIKFSYVLRYTGDAQRSDTPIMCEYTDQQGDMIVSGHSRGPEWDMMFCVYYAKWLAPVDDGTRYGTEGAVTACYGESFSVGLNLFSDGRYETADGRLSAVPGEAMFLVDGEAATYSTYMEDSSKKNRKQFGVQNKLGIDQMAFVLPFAQSMSSGDTYNAGIMDSSVAGAAQTISTAHKPMFTLLHSSSYISARAGLSDGMTRFNARMMYWDEETGIAVLYFYAAFSSAPYEMEGLAAFDLLGTGGAANAGNADYTVRVGEELKISGPSEFKTGHELWTWSYISGSEYSELHDTVSQTCTLIARKPGMVRLKVLYDYSVKEPDILTGIESTVQKEQTKEYTILITE